MKIVSKIAAAAAIALPLAFGAPARAEPITASTVVTAVAVGKVVFGGHRNTLPNKVARGVCNIFKKKKNC